MKFSEYIKEEKEVNLIGMVINDTTILDETPTWTWPANFYCDNKQLTSLKGAPKWVTGYFVCSRNNLTTLKFAPKRIDGDFSCVHNELKSLKYSPEYVGGDFTCYNNKLTSLDGVPKEIGENFNCSNNLLTSLKDIHKIIKKMNGTFYCKENPIKSHVLGLLLITGIRNITTGGREWGVILNRHLGRGREGLIDCQNELIEAGLEEYAQI